MADNRMSWSMTQRPTSGQRETARIERQIAQQEYEIRCARLNIAQFADDAACVTANQANLDKALTKLAKLQAQYGAL